MAKPKVRQESGTGATTNLLELLAGQAVKPVVLQRKQRGVVSDHEHVCAVCSKIWAGYGPKCPGRAALEAGIDLEMECWECRWTRLGARNI